MAWQRKYRNEVNQESRKFAVRFWLHWRSPEGINFHWRGLKKAFYNLKLYAGWFTFHWRFRYLSRGIIIPLEGFSSGLPFLCLKIDKDVRYSFLQILKYLHQFWIYNNTAITVFMKKYHRDRSRHLYPIFIGTPWTYTIELLSK